jgi:histidinol-phosphate/aromatic aminotransferase/cobyric acid decarboxylase-like protein/phosphoglycolate phosphatase-like HAD superfamily hydrolase
MSMLRPDLECIEPYVRPAAETAGGGKARLHMNEAAADWPDPARKALLERLAVLPFHRYPERQAELTERLRSRLGVPEGGLVLGPSSGNVLDLVALACLSPGDEVAYPDPGFSLYRLLVARHRGKARKVPVGTGFPLGPWFEALEAGARQLWLTLPNNPTGAWLSPEELEPLLEAAALRPDPPLVVIDEAYAEFAPLTHRLCVERHPNVLLLRTCSKALASAGWRLGYAIGDPALVGRMAALQLPYSIPSASLEALDVALDFAEAFDREIRGIVRRRERLSLALGGYTAPPSAANYLYVAPDPTSVLSEAGLMVRAFPGAGAARVSIGNEEEVRRTSEALGGKIAAGPARIPRRGLLVLDVDGVMIDADRSFAEAVGRAMRELAPRQAWDDSDWLAFKRVGGFNNDFRLAAGALALAERGEMDRLRGAEGVGFPDLEARIQELEPRCQEVVQRHYAVTKNLERPLVSLPELRDLGVDLAVYTGRPPEEWAMAVEVLGFELPAVSDSAPHLRKPRPDGLLQLADAFRAQDVLFVGDTRDDAACLAAARTLRPDIAWTFAGVGPDRERLGGELTGASLRSILPDIKRRLS